MSKKFDRLLADGKFTDAVRYLADELYKNGLTGHTRKMVLEQLADKVDGLSTENEKLRHLQGEICKHGKQKTCNKYSYCKAHKGPVSTCPERGGK